MCVAEVPLLKQLYWKYHDRGINLVGVSLDDDPKKVEKFVKDKSVFWPELCDGKADEGAIAKQYHVTGTPDIYVIDRAGTIAARLHSAKLLDRHLIEVSSLDEFPRRTQRDSWQRPVKIMDELGIRADSKVADIGAGRGYLTFRLAARVGPKGKVYAEDLDEEALKQVREQSQKEKLGQVETVRGTEDDPKLPASTLDAAVIVDAFHEFTQADAMLAAISRALKPGGHLGVLDRSAAPGLKPSEYQTRHMIAQENIIEQAARAGLRLISFDSDFSAPPGGTTSYFVIFEKPK